MNTHHLKKLLIVLLTFTLIGEPILLLAQSSRSRSRQQRSDQRQDKGAEGREDQLGLGIEVRWIGKIAYDAVIASGKYIVGPGDTFVILVDNGEEPQAAEALIGAEGKLVIPYVGAVQLAGLSLTQARESIQDAVKGRFRHLDITVSLARLRSFPVNIIGQVKYPGAYMIEGAEQVSELINKAGGLLEKPAGRASKRNIQVQRLSNTGVPETTERQADLAMWQVLGDVSLNPFLLDGDQVFVPTIEDSVGISGAVHRPGIHEYMPGDRVADLITMAGGFLGDAETATAELLRISREKGTEQRIRIDLTTDAEDGSSDAFRLKANDKLHVEVQEKWVTIVGEVYFPGSYLLGNGLKLDELIRKAGGFTADASLDQSTVIRKVEFAGAVKGPAQLQSVSRGNLTPAQRTYLAMKTQQTPGRLPVDFVALFDRGDVSQNIPLKDGDVVRIPRDIPSVLVNGFVITPGAIPLNTGYSIKNYIERAGGFNEQAKKDGIYVIQASTGNWIKAAKVQKIFPGDTIFVDGKKPVHRWRLFRETLVVLTQVATLVIAIRSIR